LKIILRESGILNYPGKYWIRVILIRIPSAELPGHINKRFPQRGKSLEIDRKQAELPYSNIQNLVLACYWCNNAKTDTFTEQEFQQLGQVIKRIWVNRLNRQL
jgi:hypothetical protein